MKAVRIFGIAFVTGFSGAMMPGPMLVLTVGQAGAQGMSAVWWILAGHAALEIITVLLLVAGLRQVLERPALRGAIGLIGGGFLAWMGVDMIRSASSVALNLDQAAAAFSWTELMLAGALVCVMNPYFAGWWATIGSGQLAHTAPCTAGEYIAFYVGHELSDFVWYGLVGIIAVTGAGWLSPTIYRWLIIVCGSLLIALSLWFVITGVRFLLGRQAAETPVLPDEQVLQEVCAPRRADDPDIEE